MACIGRNGLMAIAMTLCCLISSAPVPAKDAQADLSEGKDQKRVAPPAAFVSQHSGRFNGQNIDYTVTAGETYLKDGDGEPKAAIFTFDYTRREADEARPVTFVWNGGPGSASLWLPLIRERRRTLSWMRRIRYWM